MALKVYGIPTCGTCTKALKWMDEKGLTYDFVNTKVAAPTSDQIEQWVNTLTSKPMRNTSGQSYRALGDEKKDWDEATWVAEFAKDAMLLKRPLFEKDGKAVMVGFRGSDEEIMSKLS